jgi:hypothetical protein
MQLITVPHDAEETSCAGRAGFSKRMSRLELPFSPWTCWFHSLARPAEFFDFEHHRTPSILGPWQVLPRG